MPGTTRRSILKTGSAAVAGASLGGTSLFGSQSPQAEGERASAKNGETIRVALVGCGGRGTGAARQALSTEGSVQLVAMADAFSDRLEGSLAEISKHVDAARLDVPEERRFVGFDAAQKAIDSDVDLVILTTPPGFRPMHFEYAVSKGKHVFMEKPVAVDAPGVRKVLAAGEEAKRRNLKVGVGLQRHHERKYQETIRRIHDGAIGDLRLLRCFWNSGGVWVRKREQGQTEMEYQMRNWYYFNWLCGDHITEQHIHNLDVCNWIMKGFPVSAQGQGGRQVRNGMDHGEIFDHHMVEFTYADGTKMISQCRHIPNTWSSVSEHAHGTLGTATANRGIVEVFGGDKWRFRDENPNPYQVEHDVLFAAVREDRPHNEAEYGAKSTMTSILGRMATYSGQNVRWDDALKSEIGLVPEAYAWDAKPPTQPDESGLYPIPTPGVTRVL
ncbi:MAG: Gfo/Idh/MocA family oxidoreductase [bacterium]|nr:Gfo/Idh/MocA family oxidoreductase [bacterium]